MIQRKLGNDELKAFFRLIPYMGWDVLSWNMDDMYWTHGSGETYRQWQPVYQTDMVKPSDDQAYIIIDLTRRYQVTMQSIAYYFSLPYPQVFEKAPTPAYDQVYGMTFTFRPEIEDLILQILAENRVHADTATL